MGTNDAPEEARLGEEPDVLPLLPNLKEFVQQRDDVGQTHTTAKENYCKLIGEPPISILPSTDVREWPVITLEQFLSTDRRLVMEDDDSLMHMLERTFEYDHDAADHEGSNDAEEGLTTDQKDAQEEVLAPEVEESVKDKAVKAALSSIGFQAWDVFVEDIASHMPVSISESQHHKKRKRKTKRNPTLADILNSNSPYFHASFARAYQIAKRRIQKEVMLARLSEKLLQEQELQAFGKVSSMSKEEHAWFLKHQHDKLKGSDAKRFKSLKDKFAKEQEEYWDNVYATAQRNKARYDHVTERQTTQMLIDYEEKRKRIFDLLPKFMSWMQHVEFDKPLPTKDDDSAENMSQTALAFGQPPVLCPLETGTVLPGHKIYIPAVVDLQKEKDGVELGNLDWVYRKQLVPELHNDPHLGECVQQLLHQYHDDIVPIICASGAIQAILEAELVGKEVPWEIPVYIKQYDGRRICFIGKPLLSRKRTLRRKHRSLQKYAVLSASIVHEPSCRVADRETRFSLHILGRSKVIIRSHGAIQVQNKEMHDTNRNRSVFAIKTQYLNDPDMEEVTKEDIAHWHTKLALHPDSKTIEIAHVSVPRGKIVRWDSIPKEEIERKANEMFSCNFRTASHHLNLSQSLRSVLHALEGLCMEESDGWYLLVHGEGDHGASLYCESPKPSSNNAVILPQNRPRTRSGSNIFSIYQTFQSAGATDVSRDPFIPPIWQPFSSSIPQVPYTFVPRDAISEVSSITKSSTQDILAKQSRPLRRRQRHMPWGGDMDKVEHVSTISRAAYQASLAEEL